MPTSRRMTYADLMAQRDDDCLHELVRGNILRLPLPKGEHGYVEARLVAAIGHSIYQAAEALGWDESHGMNARDLLVGRVDSGWAGIHFRLPDDPDQVRGIDVGYLTPDQVARHQAVGEDEYIREVPALVAEVIGPSESAAYINEKVADYLAGGALMVWLVFPPTRTVQVHRAGEPIQIVSGAVRLEGDPVLPGFSIALGSLFS
jgi:Uma2 family endonuclease